MKIESKYSLLAFPLAFFGIPIYIYLPKFFHEHYGLDLALIGIILFLSRLVDAIYDPYIGYVSDKHQFSQKKHLIFFGLTLGVLFNIFFYMPESISKTSQYGYFLLVTVSAYILFSFIYINFYNYGLLIKNISQSIVSAKREFVLFWGIIFASTAPHLLSQSIDNKLGVYRVYAFIFLIIIFICSLFLPNLKQAKKAPRQSNFLRQMVRYFQEKDARELLLLFFINSLAVSITSNLIPFYLEHVLDAEKSLTFFLLTYFFAAACGAYIFKLLSSHVNIYQFLLAAMMLAAGSFIFTVFIKVPFYFYKVCLFSGFALGIEMAILPAIAASVINTRKLEGNGFFGLWTSLSKISLACAAGIFLPIVSRIDLFLPQIDKRMKIIALYAIIPFIIKLGSILLTCKLYRENM